MRHFGGRWNAHHQKMPVVDLNGNHEQLRDDERSERNADNKHSHNDDNDKETFEV